MTTLYVLIAILVLLVFGLIFLHILERRGNQKLKKMMLEKLEQIGTLTKDRKHYFLKLQNEEVELLFFTMKINETLTVNSDSIMQIDRMKKGPRFVKYNYQIGPMKWLFIIPGNHLVRKAINESEVEFVNLNTKFKNFRIIRVEEIDKLIEEYQNETI